MMKLLDGNADWRALSALGRYVAETVGRRAGFAAIFMFLASLTEGLSILLLIPILQLLSGASRAGHAFELPVFGTLFDGLVSGLGTGLLVLLAVIVVRSILMRLKDLYLAELMLDIINGLRHRLFDAIASARWLQLATFRSSDLDHALTADIDRVQIVLYQMLILSQTLVLLVVYGALSLLISPAMTLVALAFGVLILASQYAIRKETSRLGSALTEGRLDQYRVVSDFLGGLKLSKTLNSDAIYLRRLDQSLEKIKRVILDYTRLQSAATLLFQIASAIAMVSFAYLAMVWFKVPLERLIVLVVLFSRITPKFNVLQTTVQQILVNVSAFSAMETIRVACEAEREERATRPTQLLKDRIDLTNLSFAYPEQSEPALADVTVSIAAGRVTAIIGPSGGGKSTLADVLIGLIEPSAGAMAVDGTPLTADNRRAWRDQVAYVPQDVFLFHDTILANLRFSRPEASETEVREALEMAQALDFVERLPDGLGTIVGDRGHKLSGGERQRIALARALLRSPSLLLLDEATSALDWKSQSQVADVIAKLRGRMTIVTIAHRSSMIAFADDVIVLKDGRVVETGSFRELESMQDGHLRTMLTAENTTPQ